MASNTQVKTISSGRPQKGQRPVPSTDSLLESLRSIGKGTADMTGDLARGIPEDFFSQMFGETRPKPKASGEIAPGQSLELAQAIEEQKAENVNLRSKLAHEQNLRRELEAVAQKRTQEVQMEMHALLQEVGTLAKSTTELAQETKIAVMQVTAEPGVYHVNFVRKIREFIHSIRKKIQGASIWMNASNTRAQKKRGFWGQVGKSGAKRLLSQEDYMQRSAG